MRYNKEKYWVKCKAAMSTNVYTTINHILIVQQHSEHHWLISSSSSSGGSASVRHSVVGLPVSAVGGSVWLRAHGKPCSRCSSHEANRPWHSPVDAITGVETDINSKRPLILYLNSKCRTEHTNLRKGTGRRSPTGICV